MSDVAKFWSLTRDMTKYEKQVHEAKEALKGIYDELVSLCPHPEAADWQPPSCGTGIYRICKVCGIIDRESEGGTPGDEYNYGTGGHPSRSFWVDSQVENVARETWWSYVKDHSWHVADGKAVK